MEPEQWLSQIQTHKDAFRDQWKLKDPTGFAAQDARRKFYSDMKNKGEIAKTAVGMPVLACKMFLGPEHDTLYDHFCSINDPSVSWALDANGECQIPQFRKIAIQKMQEETDALKAGISIAVTAAAAPRPRRGTIITGTTPYELCLAAGGFLLKQSPLRPMRGIDDLLIEVYASDHYGLTHQMPNQIDSKDR